MSLTGIMRRDRSGIVEDVGAVLGDRKPLRRLGDEGSTIVNVCNCGGKNGKQRKKKVKKRFLLYTGQVRCLKLFTSLDKETERMSPSPILLDECYRHKVRCLKRKNRQVKGWVLLITVH
jgi:hypothetical protein